jgi:hypothetical protein
MTPPVSDYPLPVLPQRGKEPTSKRHLDAWVEQAASRAGIVNSRLGWLVGSSVVIAALQRARHHDGGSRFRGEARLTSVVPPDMLFEPVAVSGRK